MPVNSKYSTENVQQLLDAVFDIFDKNQTPVDLQLMILGDATSNILNNRVSAASRQKLADQFASALRGSLHND